MNDLLTAADTLQECKEYQVKVSSHLDEYAFHLRKWVSNNKEVLQSINIKSHNEVLDIGVDGTLKTLGLQWNPQNDTFSFNMHLADNKPVTKQFVQVRC